MLLIFLSADKRCTKFCIDLSDLLFAVDIRLVNALDSASAAVVASGTELAVDPACPPQRLMNNADPLFARRLFDQYGVHFLISPF